MHQSLVALLACCFLFAKVNCHRYRIISNKTMPCYEMSEMLAAENEGRPPRWTQLNEEEKKQLLHMRGNGFIRSFVKQSYHDRAIVSSSLLPNQFVASTKNGHRPSLISKILTRLQSFLNTKNVVSRSVVLPNTTHCNVATYDKPEEIHLNNGAVMTIDICRPRGCNIKDDGKEYLTMCSACTTTVKFPSENFWPHIWFGVICNPTDNKCLYNGSKHSGQCIDTKVPVRMLKRSSNICLMGLMENNEKIIAQDWQEEQEEISMGCECAASKHSKFSKRN